MSQPLLPASAETRKFTRAPSKPGMAAELRQSDRACRRWCAAHKNDKTKKLSPEEPPGGSHSHRTAQGRSRQHIRSRI
uniref:Uncharacterized protein n=1 Tax=Suricata suricatta TaxID=37032 RepID=A0A673TII3_SURSU